MGILDETGSIERQQFFDGQRLLATDLQGLEAFHREMRELHNRSLHQPGIGNGFAISGERGHREVTIGPGYALDVSGHEIILTLSRIEPVPPVQGGDGGEPAFYHLAVSYPSDEYLEESETRQGLCRTHGAVRLREEPVFCWVRLTRDGTGKLRPVDKRLDLDIKAGRKIVLARLEIRGCQLEKRPYVAQRRNARPASQPRIVCGRERHPDWSLIGIEDPWSAPPYFLKATVDTSDAHLLTTPCYTARIDRPRPPEGPNKVKFLGEGLLSIESPKADEFKVRVRLLPIPTNEQLSLLKQIAGNAAAVDKLFADWSIEWMAVE